MDYQSGDFRKKKQENLSVFLLSAVLVAEIARLRSG